MGRFLEMNPDNKIVIQGIMPSKSNCYRIFSFTDKAGRQRASMSKRPELKKYESDSAFQFPAELKDKMHGGNFKIQVNVYYPSARADLDNSMKGILDCLQMVGYIKNDNKCQEIIARRFIDKGSPRIEFEIIHYENELF